MEFWLEDNNFQFLFPCFTLFNITSILFTKENKKNKIYYTENCILPPNFMWEFLIAGIELPLLLRQDRLISFSLASLNGSLKITVVHRESLKV